MANDADRIQTRREEAIAFFHVNQTGRNAVERVVALFFSVAAIAGSVGVAAGTPDVLLPLPALLFLLLSYMFQQYADLTVLGCARRRLEDLVNAELEAKGLVYETVAYLGGTLLAILSFAYSYLHMLRTPRITGEKLAEQGLDYERLVWISAGLFDEARKAAGANEFERQTFERLIRRGLSQDG